MDLSEEKYYLEKVEIPIYEDSEYDYQSIKADEILTLEDKADETLEHTSKLMEEINDDDCAMNEVMFSNRPKLTVIPPTIDDFVRSFLLRLGFTKTLDCFQLEWFERKHKGLLQQEDLAEVPDIYVRNQELDSDLKTMRDERNKYKEAALSAKEMHVKLRSERDFHKLQHRRLLQEKNKLIDDLKKIREHYSSYEPAIESLQKKYQTAMKEKMLSRLERDRVCGQMQGLQASLQGLGSVGLECRAQRGGVLTQDKTERGPTQRRLLEARIFADQKEPDQHGRQESLFPVDTGMNEELCKVKAPPGHLTRVGGFRLTNTIQAHEAAVTCVRLSADRRLLCSTGEDNLWRVWAVEGLEPVLTGTGHLHWVSGAAFDGAGGRLATCSGDKTVKVWDLQGAQCLSTLSGHSRAIWSVDWHPGAPILVSGGLDRVIKLWDVGNEPRCRGILRGHSDSVNSVCFLVNSNIVLSASADKNLGLWDARTGINGQMIIGHQHSVNSAHINQRGNCIASCDSFGFANFWDCRRLDKPIKSLDLGFHPTNDIRFDSSGACVAVCSNDGVVKMVETSNYEVTTLVGHAEAVQSSVFDPQGEFLVSAASDCTIRVWS